MNKMRHSSRGLRLTLLAGASVVALAAAAPNAVAADLSKPNLTKAPPPAPVAKDTWTWWIEGGAFNTAGDDFNKGVPGVGIKPKWGPEGAVGFDWRPFSPMHVVGQFRYGSATRSKPLNFTAASGGGTVVTTTGSQNLREDHWLVDFGIGRDFGLGNSHAMWTLGVRVADLRAKLTANGSFHATTFTPTVGGVGTTKTVFTGAFSALEKSTFVGAGPRFGVQGDIPLGGQWSIDWLAGAAVLFGERSLQLTATAGGITAAANSSDSPAVFNVDAQAGLSYWFSPTMKIGASYRFDGYFKALKTLNTATGGTTNIDRFYNGPMLRLTSTF
ncbi:MAG TPA: Lpg1974 family pore-forming outer membrane protein [Xanthobacteraceae bacterium]|nr:Lpg1974 family pore-forming outer membrane protein [Xanthobacteraceae bacterium]